MRLNVKDLVDKKFPNKNQFSKAIGVGFPSTCKIYDGETTSIKFSTLETICKVLDCTPNDIIIPDKHTN